MSKHSSLTFLMTCPAEFKICLPSFHNCGREFLAINVNIYLLLVLLLQLNPDLYEGQE